MSNSQLPLKLSAPQESQTCQNTRELLQNGNLLTNLVDRDALITSMRRLQLTSIVYDILLVFNILATNTSQRIILK